MAYRIAAIPMTLSDPEVIHLLQALFKCVFFVQLCSSWKDFNGNCASRGPSVIAELLVNRLTISFQFCQWVEEASVAFECTLGCLLCTFRVISDDKLVDKTGNKANVVAVIRTLKDGKKSRE